MPRLSCRSDVHPCRRHRSGPEGDEGFTLIELLVVVLVLPLVVGAISVAMIAVFKLQTGVSNRISGSGDAQIASANFVRDVQNAATITTLSTPQCGSGGTEVLGLFSSMSASEEFHSPNSYSEAQRNGFLPARNKNSRHKRSRPKSPPRRASCCPCRQQTFRIAIAA